MHEKKPQGFHFSFRAQVKGEEEIFHFTPDLWRDLPKFPRADVNYKQNRLDSMRKKRVKRFKLML